MRVVMPVALPEVLRLPGAVYVLPTVVFEIRSPDDETFEKLPFYAAAGVLAVVVVDRDTKAVQVSRVGPHRLR